MASSSTTPNDSPRSDGAQNTSAPRSRAAFSASLIRPEPLDPGIAGDRAPAARRSRARRRRPTAGRRRAASAMASSSTARPLRGSWRPRKKIVGPVGRPRRRLGEAVDLDAVEQRVVGAAEVRRWASVRGVVGHRAAQVEPAGQPAHRRAEPPVGGAVAGGVERADDRRGLEQQRRHRRPGHERLVEVEDVEPLVARGPGWCAAEPTGRGRAGRPSRWRRSGCCSERVTPASGGGPSHGASTRASWPSARSTRASPSTWPCTPPGSVKLYGHTRPTRSIRSRQARARATNTT